MSALFQTGGWQRVLAVLLICAGLLSACAAPEDEEAVVFGGSSPDAAVEDFIEDLNLALQSPDLLDLEARQAWAERLAGYFAPSERIDQRAALGTMLANFATSANQPIVGSRLSFSITYTGTEVISRTENEALVRLVDGTINLRWLDEQGEVVRERTGSLMDVIGQTNGGLPVLLVNGLWFMTEG